MQPPNDFTTSFRAALKSGPETVGLSYTDPKEAARRFAVYRNNVAHSLGQALARRFPVIERLVGTEFFAAMAKEFIAGYPPRSPVLQEWGGEFPVFLKNFPPVASLPYLPDVAQIEWARGRAYHATDVTPIASETLANRETLHLHPSLILLRSSYPSVSIWQANQPDKSGHVIETGAETALIWRRKDLSVATITIDSTDVRFLTILRETTALSQAAEQCDPVAMLSFLLREELICEEEY